MRSGPCATQPDCCSFLFGFSREGLTMEPQTAWNLLCRSGWLQTCNNLSASAVRTWNYKHGSPPARMTGSYQSSSTWPLAPTHKLAKALRLVGTRAYCREKTVALLLQIVKEPGFCPWPFLKLILTIAIKLYMYDSQIHFFHLNLFWAFMSVFLHTGHHHPDMTETLWTHISMMKPVFPLALPWRPTSITESPFTSLFKVSPQLFPILIQWVTA